MRVLAFILLVALLSALSIYPPATGLLAGPQDPGSMASRVKRPPTCSGGQVLKYNATSGEYECQAEGSAGGVVFREFSLCAPGNTAAGVCHTFTNLGASFVEVGNSASRDHLDLSSFTDFRILANVSVAASTGDIVIQCDADAALGSPTTLGTLDNPTTGFPVGTWTAIPAGECKTTGGQYMRAGMANGNTTEDPAVRFIRLQVR